MHPQSRIVLCLMLTLCTVSSSAAQAAARAGPADTSHWNLQLPTGRPKHPDTLRGAQIDRADQYGVKWVREGLLLTANAGGVTTPGSHHARSELGERKGAGIPRGGWNNGDGKMHRLDLVTTVTKLPARKPELTIMQIKDQGSNDKNVGIEVIPAKRNGQLKDGLIVAIRVLGGKYRRSVVPVIVDKDYTLGTPLRFVVATKDRRLTIDFNGKRVVDRAYSIDHASFKAGAYTQFSTSADGLPRDAEGQVIISRLEATHR